MGTHDAHSRGVEGFAGDALADYIIQTRVPLVLAANQFDDIFTNSGFSVAQMRIQSS